MSILSHQSSFSSLHPDYVFILHVIFIMETLLNSLFLGFNFQAFVCDKKSKKQVVIIVYDFSILNTQMSCHGYFFLT